MRRRRYNVPAPYRAPTGVLIEKRYVSIDELVAVAHGPSEMSPEQRASREKPASERQGDRNSWAGASWDDASKWARSGDVAGARRLAPIIMEEANAFVHGQRRLDPEYRLDEGQWIDVSRYVKGEPECWGAMVEADPVPRRGVAVIINVATSSNVRGADIDKVGISIGGAILGMQARGYSVTLYAAERISGNGELLITAPINPGAGTLDVSRLSMILRPWFLRRVIFSLQETYDRDIRERFNIGGGYGRPAPLTKADAVRIIGNEKDRPVLVDVNTAVNNPDGVRDLILRQIKGD